VDGFANKKLLVVGGAGFVGSNLVLALLEHDPAEVLVVDSLLSAERANVPDDPRVRFVHASVTDARVLAGLPEDLDYAWHLATFHGNQNSIADPIADLQNNTAPAVYLYNRLKDLRKLRKVVYSAAGCTHAEKTFDKANPTKEDAPISLWLDSPYQISKISGEPPGAAGLSTRSTAPLKGPPSKALKDPGGASGLSTVLVGWSYKKTAKLVPGSAGSGASKAGPLSVRSKLRLS
jgi:hypothetical protein